MSRLKIFVFPVTPPWYDDGVMLIAANTIDEADTLADACRDSAVTASGEIAGAFAEGEPRVLQQVKSV